MKWLGVLARNVWIAGTLGVFLLTVGLAGKNTIRAERPDRDQGILSWQSTLTPVSPTSQSGPRRAAGENAPPMEMMPEGISLGPRDQRLPETGRVQVLVELSDPPAARAYAIARNVLGLPETVANALAGAQMARIEAAQQTLLADLTGPEINAIVIGRVQRAMNGIMIEVDATKLDLIRQLPGVIGIRRLGIGTLEGSEPSVEPGPVLGPQEPGYPEPPGAGTMTE